METDCGTRTSIQSYILIYSHNVRQLRCEIHSYGIIRARCNDLLGLTHAATGVVIVRTVHAAGASDGGHAHLRSKSGLYKELEWVIWDGRGLLV